MLTLKTLEACAESAGFDAVGVARATYLAEDDQYLRKWLEQGYQGSMQYMERNLEKRTDPRQLLEGTKSVVAVLLNYYKTEPLPAGVPYISLSGRSKQDYHDVMRQQLYKMEYLLREKTHGELATSEKQHIFCDSAPLLERRWAQRAGLGWIGKNHLLIHPKFGSFVHIGLLLLNEEVTPYSTPTDEQCGECDRCLRSCPTGALRAPMFDARKCLSYLTIERREPLGKPFAEIVSRHLYGCDVCQRCCPYNAHLTATSTDGLQTNPILLDMTAEDWAKSSRRQKLKILRRLAHNDETTTITDKQNDYESNE